MVRRHLSAGGSVAESVYQIHAAGPLPEIGHAVHGHDIPFPVVIAGPQHESEPTGEVLVRHACAPAGVDNSEVCKPDDELDGPAAGTAPCRKSFAASS